MLDNFRELLLKKTQGTDLEYLVKYVRDEVLVDTVIESLEKMARGRHKGDAANIATREFAMTMDPEIEGYLIRDALGHHASRYKAALQSGRKDLANAHARQIFKIMDFADQAQKHSGGKLSVEAVSPQPWERNIKTNTYDESHPLVQAGKRKPGQFVTDTKGWRYRGRDYSFLQQAPHPSYANEVAEHGHVQAYPIEKIRVNGKYITIQDIDPSELKGFEKHHFDEHPILEHYKIPAAKYEPEHHMKYKDLTDQYYDRPHLEEWIDKHHAMHDENPHLGKEPSGPVHPEVEPLNLEEALAARRARAAGARPKKQPKAAVEPPKSKKAAQAEQLMREYGLSDNSSVDDVLRAVKDIKRRYSGKS